MRRPLSFVAVSTVAMVAASPAAAVAQARAFDVSAQPAATGIVAFARQAGIQIIAPEEATRQRRTGAVRGTLTVGDALRQLIGATNLRVVSFDGRTAVLAAAPVMRPVRAVARQGDPAANPGAPQADTVNRPGETPPQQMNDELEAIVVTGTRTRGQRVLTSSSAVTVATREDLDRKAPRSTAQALELIPGIFVEGSGGEVSNNFSVRGLAGGGQQFEQLQEDGLPVFYINALSDTILKQEVSIDRLEAVRSGSSGILTVNGAGATINFITRKPDFDKSGGTFQLTTSSFATARVDAFMTRPLGENIAISLGGFYRRDDGIRDPGYDANHGFLFRGAIAQRWDGGKLTLSAKVVDDHNTFFVPIPVQGVGNPDSIAGLSATHGLLQSRDFSRVRVRTTPTTGASFKDIDLEDAVHTRSQSYGYDLTQDFGSELNFFARGRYTNFGADFNSIFSYDNSALQLATERFNTNPALGAVNPTTTQTLAAFAPFGATQLGLRYVDTGQIVAGAANLNAINGNGLIAESVIGNNRAEVREFNSDTGITWQTPTNSLTVGGLFTRSSRYNDAIGAATFITDVQDRARRVDVVALNAAGQAVGSLTENGFLNYGTFGEGPSRAKFTSISAYATDQLTLWDKLRIDGGARYEHFVFNRLGGVTAGRTPIAGAGIFAPDGTLVADRDNILANNYIAQYGGGSFTGQFDRQRRVFDKVAWTLGANYLLTDRLAVYGRYATGFQAQEQNEPTDLRFGEAGVRYSSRVLQASITGFYTEFLDYPQSRDINVTDTVNGVPVTVTRQLTANSGIKVYGGEFDVTVRPVEWFRVQATGVIQDSKISIRSLTARQNGNEIALNLIPQSLQDQVNGFEGNKPERTPALNVTVTPSVVLPNNLGEIYGSWKRIGKIYADVSNSLELPGYSVFSAGVMLNVAQGITFNASVENIGNAVGLTEGNPRGGFTENTGQNFYFARPINGTNAVASLRFDF